MKPMQIVGLLLILAGVFVLWKKPTYEKKKNVIEIGDIKASVDEHETVPTWVGAVAIGAGAIMLFAGSRKAAS